MSNETEQLLVEAIRSGDKQAKHRLYTRYCGHAMAIALRYMSQRDEAQDVLQDSFVKILTTIDGFDYRGEGSLKAWVCRIVANQAIDHLQQRQRITFVSDVPEDAEEEAPDVRLVPPEVLTRLIGQLPTGYRLVLNMHVFERLPHKEIARRLNIKEDTSSSQFNRAKKKLAQMLRQYLKEQEKL